MDTKKVDVMVADASHEFYVDKIFPSAFVREDIVFITKGELEEYLIAD